MTEDFIPPHGGYRNLLSYRKAEIVVNIIICLIHQANYLLDRQIRQLEQAFLKEGGLRERMTRARLASRAAGSPSGTVKEVQPANRQRSTGDKT